MPKQDETPRQVTTFDSATVAQLDRRDPFVVWQTVDVQFPATANTDYVIRHNLKPSQPHDVHYRVIKQFTGGTVYESVDPAAKDWTSNFIVLRSDTANWTGRILLGLLGRNVERFAVEEFDIPTTTSATDFTAGSDQQIIFNQAGTLTGEANLKWDYTNNRLKMETAQYYVKLYENATSGSAATINWDNSNDQMVTLTANCTLTFSNPVDGGRYCLLLKQDGTGSRTVTWPASVVWNAGTAPTLTATAGYLDLTTFIYVASLGKYIGAHNVNYAV